MEKELSPETVLKFEMVGGKLKLSVAYAGAQVDGAVAISADSDVMVDALLALLPGDSAFEKMMGDLLKSALKSVVV